MVKKKRDDQTIIAERASQANQRQRIHTQAREWTQKRVLPILRQISSQSWGAQQ